MRIKRLREERQLTQAALASALGLSLSYLNQLENNQRPLTVPVLLKFNSAFGVDVQLFSEDDEARLIGDLREALSDPAIGETIATAELRELVSNMPAVGRALVSIHRRYHRALKQAAALASRLGDDRQGYAPVIAATPFEEVRDFFYARHNHIAELDDAAERIALDGGLPIGAMAAAISDRLQREHGVRVMMSGAEEVTGEVQRSYDPDSRVLRLSPHLGAGQTAFQVATQLAFLEQR